MTKAAARVRLFPTGYYIPGVRAVERLVPADAVDVLTRGPNPAFTRDGTASEIVHEGTDDLDRVLPGLVAEINASSPPPEATPDESRARGGTSDG